MHWLHLIAPDQFAPYCLSPDLVAPYRLALDLVAPDQLAPDKAPYLHETSSAPSTLLLRIRCCVNWVIYECFGKFWQI